MSNLERIAFIDHRLRERRSISSREIAETFEVSLRQVKRDIEYLRNRLGAPIIWDRSQAAYFYGRPWDGLRFADERTLLFSVFLKAAASTLSIMPIVAEEALAVIEARIPISLRALSQHLRYDIPELEAIEPERLSLFLKAIQESRLLDIHYRDVKGATSVRRILPSRIINYAGVWYFIAYDIEREALRIFRFSRIIDATILSDSMDMPLDVDEIETYINGSYGIFKGKGIEHATIRFFGKAREIVRDEIWHPDQERNEAVDPSRGEFYELTIPTASYEELKGRVLRFGTLAEVVAPKEFRDLWLQSIDALTRLASDIRAKEREGSDPTLPVSR